MDPAIQIQIKKSASRRERKDYCDGCHRTKADVRHVGRECRMCWQCRWNASRGRYFDADMGFYPARVRRFNSPL